MRERDIQQGILLALSPYCVMFRNNIGVASMNGSVVRFGVGGQGGADLIGVRRSDGKFVAIEVKAPGGKVSDAQAQFRDLVNAAGGLAFIARSIEEAVAMVTKGCS